MRAFPYWVSNGLTMPPISNRMNGFWIDDSKVPVTFVIRNRKSRGFRCSASAISTAPGWSAYAISVQSVIHQQGTPYCLPRCWSATGALNMSPSGTSSDGRRAAAMLIPTDKEAGDWSRSHLALCLHAALHRARHALPLVCGWPCTTCILSIRSRPGRLRAHGYEAMLLVKCHVNV